MIYAFAIGFLYGVITAEERYAERANVLLDGLTLGFSAVLAWGLLSWLLG